MSSQLPCRCARKDWWTWTLAFWFGWLVLAWGPSLVPSARRLARRGTLSKEQFQIRNHGITDSQNLTNKQKQSAIISHNLTPNISSHLLQMPGERADRSTWVLPACFQRNSHVAMANPLTYRGEFVQCSWLLLKLKPSTFLLWQTLTSDMGTTGIYRDTLSIRLVVDECLRVKGTRPGEVFNSETESSCFSALLPCNKKRTWNGIEMIRNFQKMQNRTPGGSRADWRWKMMEVIWHVKTAFLR